MIHSYEDIDAYKRSKKLYPHIIKLAKTFPPHCRHIRDQLCRSSNSIHANIAEGFGRSVAEFKMYLQRALGSCNETKSHIDDCVQIGVVSNDEGKKLLEEYIIIGKQIYRLRENWK
ncbi:four helix bundle protein [Candidatus Uhrbacteria bacterium]|nr:four helix bundle protein [Candidatus Uhrbacteria bacterium]